MANIQVKLNKLSSDWHFVKALVEDEYKTYLDKALDKIKTRYEFTAHLLDVHQMWCAECPHSGCLAQAVRSDRDTISAAGSQAAARVNMVNQQTELQSDAPDTGLYVGVQDGNVDKSKDENKDKIREMGFPTAMACYDEDGEIQTDVNTITPNNRGIKRECHDDESIQCRDKKRRDNDLIDNLQVQLPETLVADVQSEIDWTYGVSDLHILIKEEQPSQDSCPIDLEIRNPSTSLEDQEERIPTQPVTSELLCHLERTSPASDLTKQETASEAHCDVDMDSRRRESTFLQGNEEGNLRQFIGLDGKTIWENNREPPKSTHNTDEQGPESSTHSQYDAGIFSNNSVQIQCGSEINSFQCQFCRKICYGWSAFHVHMRKHCGTNPQSCQCLICKKDCITKQRLIVHMRTHTGEKPFKCNYCSYRSSQKHSLIVHTRTHTGEKPYHCPSCDKKFVSKSKCSLHIKTHTGERRHKCPICNAHFRRSDHLRSHMMRTHSGEKI